VERLLKAYVGYGVADDFCKAAAVGLDEVTCTLVMQVLDGTSHAALVVDELGAASAHDDVLSSRLALWGRRLVGEALGVVQALLQTQPGSLAWWRLRIRPRPTALSTRMQSVGCSTA